MKHIKAILIKFAMVAVVLEIILSIVTDLTFSEILVVSAAVTLLAYVLGDLMILPAANNTVATIADSVLAFFTIYAFNFVWPNRTITFWDSLIAAVVLGIGEIIFHSYVEKKILPDKKTT